MTNLPWPGAARIVRFNWPTYVAAGLTLLFSMILILVHRGPTVLEWIVFVGTFYYTAASVVVSHWVYDRSPIATWTFVKSWLPALSGQVLLVQAGFDPSYGALSNLLKNHTVTLVDFYGQSGFGGASVDRARKVNRISRVVSAQGIPAGDNLFDVILAPFALHEARDLALRETMFNRFAQGLRPQGRLVIVEHLRDARNFAAFGLGFMHFLPEREWRRLGARVSLVLTEERRITPFVKVFVWTRS